MTLGQPQVDRARFQLLKLEYDEPPSKFDFNCNLRRYKLVCRVLPCNAGRDIPRPQASRDNAMRVLLSHGRAMQVDPRLTHIDPRSTSG